MATARERVEEAVAEITARYEQVKTRGSVPLCLDSAVEEKLDTAIAEAFHSNDPARVLEAVESWRRAWLEVLAIPTSKTRDGTVNAIVVETAGRLDVDRLFDLATDPATPAAEKTVYAAEVRLRARELVEEAEGRRPHPNQAVHDMFDRADLCRHHPRWRSVYGVTICGECHPPAHPGLVAEWLPKPAAGPPTEDSG